MIQELGTFHLRNGAAARVIRACEPDKALSGVIARLLGHKGDPWVRHIDDCMSGLTPGLVTDFYLAEVDDNIVANVTLWTNERFGNISHVFTAPEMRGLGIAKTLLKACIEGFEQTGGEVMVLGTGYDTMPYRLYESFRFSGICPEQSYGGMVRFLNNANWETVPTGPPGGVCKADWRHFVGAQALFGSPGDTMLRSMLLPCVGPRFPEEQYIRLMYNVQSSPTMQAWVIEGREGGVLGFGAVGPHPVWGQPGRRAVLDLYLHASGSELEQALLDEMLSANPGPVVCYCDSRSSSRIQLLKSAGFTKLSCIPSELSAGTTALDVVMLARDG